MREPGAYLLINTAARVLGAVVLLIALLNGWG